MTVVALAWVAIMAGVLWLNYYYTFGQRGRAERAIREFLSGRGQRLVSTRIVWFSRKRFLGQGLSRSATVYRVEAADSDGTPRTYEWAYDPFSTPTGEPGLRRYSGGSWFDAR